MSDFYKEAFHAVGDMRRGFGHVVSGDGRAREDVQFEANLIFSEIDETITGMLSFDVVETIDGLCDILVTTIGGLHWLGATDSDIDDAVQNIIEQIQSGTKSEVIIGIFNEISSAGSLQELCSVALSFVVFMTYDNSRLQFEQNFWEVHRTNMNKFFNDKDAALLDVDVYRSEGVDCNVHYTADGQFVIKRSSDGKVMKPINWEQPEIIIV